MTLAETMTALRGEKETQMATKTVCDSDCRHIDPSAWPHNVKEQEDRGEIHTDDCDFFSEAAQHVEDPGDLCTAGRPGVNCRVPRGNQTPLVALRLAKDAQACAEAAARMETLGQCHCMEWLAEGIEGHNGYEPHHERVDCNTWHPIVMVSGGKP